MPGKPIDIYFAKDSYLLADRACEGYNMSEQWWQKSNELFEKGILLSLYKREAGLGRTMINKNLKIVNR